MPDPTLSPSVTPIQRLSQSRQALVRYMNGEPALDVNQKSGSGHDAHQPSNDPVSAFGTVRHVVQMWWQHHPLNSALDLARPFIGNYAREHPLKLLGIAAAAGAAAVVIRPWRLVSVGGLLLATLKSSEMSSIVMSLMSRQPAPRTSNLSQENHHEKS